MILPIKLFAIARQRLGRDEVEVTLPASATAGDLRRALAEQFPALADVLPHIRIAINSSYANDATVIPAGAEVALIPPVSGG
ncbi:MAG: MoaD/ThiS family protein [Planctomycetales bacterium]|nr:MoaD/ThiS family protein [Planctomycetales bacterium]